MLDVRRLRVTLSGSGPQMNVPIAHRLLIALVLLSTSPSAGAIGRCDSVAKGVRSFRAATIEFAPAKLSSADFATQHPSSSPELTQAEADRMLFWAVVSDARLVFRRNVRRLGTAKAARIAVAMLRRDRAVRSAVFNPQRYTLTVVLRSGFTGEASLMSKEWGDSGNRHLFHNGVELAHAAERAQRDRSVSA
jgi:hypothetical protein